MVKQTTFNPWINCLKPNPRAELRLFCLPYAGGSAMIYRTWGNYLPSTIEVCPVELPGRGKQIKSSPYDKLEPLVEVLAENIQQYLDKPFAIFGHSLGGLISFEFCRFLRSEFNLRPVHLFVSACKSPQIIRTEKPVWELSYAELVDKMRRLNGTPEEILQNQELLQLFIPIWRADFAILDNYIYTHQPVFNFPISVFGGLKDDITVDNLQAWQEHTTSFYLRMFEGNHFYINSVTEVFFNTINHKLSESRS
ncbi:MAG TPA: thioesterase domain-containing protein [Nostocaceae cyanobacterium]|nr:thioesterase domain-containing protein [Nostocaceae cyanobacterium]